MHCCWITKQQALSEMLVVFLVLVEHRGIEPLTSWLPVMRAPSCANAPKPGFQWKKKSSLPVISQANCFWSHWPGSNRPPARYECAALPDELQWHAQINKLIDRMMIFYYVKKLPSIRKFQFPGIFLLVSFLLIFHTTFTCAISVCRAILFSTNRTWI